ncbi:hypothetical protein H0H92_001556 [Tricholoma furcatifolium]|nr:hypothetical protein H0H92_001556 [Tricholoma furcatifolium]
MQRKKASAEAILESCNQPIEYLRVQWKLQVKAQTKPLPRQSKNAGKNAINELLCMRETRDELKEEVNGYNEILIQEDLTTDAHIEVLADLQGAKQRLKDLGGKIRRKESVLGVQDQEQLRRLVNNPYIAAVTNALAVKERLRDRLRSRKFELNKVERSFRKQINDNKINEHTAASVKRRDPSISKLAWTYNSLQKKLVELIDKGRAPPGAVVPQKIEMKGLFALDVDDSIWQDTGLTGDASDIDTTPPPWLADDSVRDGIRALLELDRCMEEDARLKQEFSNIRLWLSEEWDIVNSASEKADTEGVAYFLNRRRTKLLQFCAIWQDAISNIYGEDMDVWGPSEEEIDNMRNTQRTESLGNAGIESDDEGEELDDDDAGLFDTLEAVDLADAFRTNFEEEYLVD